MSNLLTIALLALLALGLHGGCMVSSQPLLQDVDIGELITFGDSWVPPLLVFAASHVEIYSIRSYTPCMPCYACHPIYCMSVPASSSCMPGQNPVQWIWGLVVQCILFQTIKTRDDSISTSDTSIRIPASVSGSSQHAAAPQPCHGPQPFLFALPPHGLQAH